MKTFNFATETETKTYFYDSINDRFTTDENTTGSTFRLNGEWERVIYTPDTKIIVNKSATAQEVDKLMEQVYAA